MLTVLLNGVKFRLLFLIGSFKVELWHKMNLWSNKTLVPSQPFSEICFHDNRM